MIVASSAARSGDIARPESSRRVPAAPSSADLGRRPHGRSAAASSRCAAAPVCRREAVRNTFTGASGKTTEPMSRPSTTPPPCCSHPGPLAGDELPAHRGMRRDRRHRARSPRARGSRPTRRRRRARTVRRSSSMPTPSAIRRAPAPRRRGRPRPSSTASVTDAVHRAGVEHVEPERGRDPARDRGLPRARRPVDGDDPVGSSAPPGGRPGSAAKPGYEIAHGAASPGPSSPLRARPGPRPPRPSRSDGRRGSSATRPPARRRGSTSRRRGPRRRSRAG